jgi:hypothetical protein
MIPVTKFGLSQNEYYKLIEWLKTKDLSKYTGAIGGRFTYSFTPTSLGIVIKAMDNLENNEIDLTDYDVW